MPCFFATIDNVIQQPTLEDVEALKRAWCHDPIFDLWSVPGFEAYKPELELYARTMEASWAKERIADRQRRAAAMGLQDNPQLFNYIERLEERLSALERKFAEG